MKLKLWGRFGNEILFYKMKFHYYILSIFLLTFYVICVIIKGEV
jgi:hypothetical protein